MTQTQAIVAIAAHQLVDDLIAAAKANTAQNGKWWTEIACEMDESERRFADYCIGILPEQKSEQEFSERQKAWLDRLSDEQKTAFDNWIRAAETPGLYNAAEERELDETCQKALGPEKLRQWHEILALKVEVAAQAVELFLLEGRKKRLENQGLSHEEDMRQRYAYCACPVRSEHADIAPILHIVVNEAIRRLGDYYPRGSSPLRHINNDGHRWRLTPNMAQGGAASETFDLNDLHRVLDEKILPTLQNPARWTKSKKQTGTTLSLGTKERDKNDMLFNAAEKCLSLPAFSAHKPILTQEIDGAAVDERHYRLATMRRFGFLHNDMPGVVTAPLPENEEEHMYTRHVHFVGPEAARSLQECLGVDILNIKEEQQRQR